MKKNILIALFALLVTASAFAGSDPMVGGSAMYPPRTSWKTL